MKKSPTQHPTAEEVGQHGISKYRGIDVGLGAADPMTGIAAKLEAQYPNHLVLVQAGTFRRTATYAQTALITGRGRNSKSS
jgi:hypothetical protein